MVFKESLVANSVIPYGILIIIFFGFVTKAGFFELDRSWNPDHPSFVCVPRPHLQRRLRSAAQSGEPSHNIGPLPYLNLPVL